jgi:hypothetical protein
MTWGDDEIICLGIGDHLRPIAIPEPDELAAIHPEAPHSVGMANVNWIDRDAVALVACEIMHGPKVLVPSRVCLGLLDDFDGLGWEKLFQFVQFGSVFLHTVPKGERDATGLSSELVREDCQRVIEGLPKVLKNVLDGDLHILGDARGSKLVDFLRSIRIHANAGGIRVAMETGLDFGIELLDFGTGPFDLAVRPCERLRFHDSDGLNPRPKQDPCLPQKELRGTAARRRRTTIQGRKERAQL